MEIIDSPSGKVVKTPTGYRSFIPNPLPPDLNWSFWMEMDEWEDC